MRLSGYCAGLDPMSHAMARLQSREERQMGSHESSPAWARQARLVDWLKHPTGVPHGPAIDYTFAMWTAQELVDLTGLYAKRSEALYDLRALRDRGVVVSAGGRWRYHHVWEDTAEAVR